MDKNTPTTLSLTDRALIRAEGKDAETLFQGLVSTDVERLSAGDLRFTTLLTPQGKIAFEFFLLKTPDGFWIDVAQEFAATLLKRLKLYRLRADVSLDPISSHGVRAIFDPAPSDDSVNAPSGAPSGALTAHDPRWAPLGLRCYEPIAADTPTDPEKIETPDPYYVWERRHGIPALGRDFAPDSQFLLDMNYDLLGGVSRKKGCFVGQEVTSRMMRKSDIRKRTLIIEQNTEDDGALPFQSGEKITIDDAAVGTILGPSDEVASIIALGVFRVDRLAGATKANYKEAVVSIRAPDYMTTPNTDG